MPNLSHKVLRIGVIRTSSIGDVVLASACLDLASRLDGIEIVWIGRNPAMTLLQTAWPNTTFVELPKSLKHAQITPMKSQIGTLNAVVDLQTNMRSRWFTRSAKQQGIPTISAQKIQRRRLRLLILARLRGRKLPLPHKARGETNERQYQLMLNAFANMLITLGVPETRVRQAEALARPNLKGLTASMIETPWGRELEFGSWLAVAPGAAYATKQAPIALWVEALKEFQPRGDSAPFGILIAGGDADRKAAVTFLDQLAWSGPVLNLAGRLSLVETAQALAKVRVLMTNDSGLLHIAESVGTPVVAVFGPTIEGFGFPPWRIDSKVFSSPVGCRPCSKHGKTSCRYSDRLCFESINTKVMSTAVDTLMQRPAVSEPQGTTPL